MSSLSNEEITAEFGWTQQIISDLSGGRVPRYWRPPYGDSDNRVRAIAQHIFGLTQVDWNQDTSDWELPSGGVTAASVEANLQTWLSGPKSPGLIILEHELYAQTVSMFIDTAYPLMVSNGWDMRSIPDLEGMSYYLNADDTNKTSNNAPVSSLEVIAGPITTLLFTPSPTSSSAPTQTGPTSSSSPSSQASQKKSAASLNAMVHSSGLFFLVALLPAIIFYVS